MALNLHDIKRNVEKFKYEFRRYRYTSRLDVELYCAFSSAFYKLEYVLCCVFVYYVDMCYIGEHYKDFPSFVIFHNIPPFFSNYFKNSAMYGN